MPKDAATSAVLDHCRRCRAFHVSERIFGPLPVVVWIDHVGGENGIGPVRVFETLLFCETEAEAVVRYWSVSEGVSEAVVGVGSRSRRQVWRAFLPATV